MKKSIFIGCVTTGILPVMPLLAQDINRQPNIIFIISDQHQYKALGCYGDVNTTINGTSPTPNIDRLAENGIVFDNCYTASPVSAPSRASIETGCYPSDHSAIHHQYDKLEPGYRRFPGILEDKQTIADLLRNNGYVTAAFGKMHVHGELKDVNDLGYDSTDLRFYTRFPGGHYSDRANGDWYNRYRELPPYKEQTYHSINKERFASVAEDLKPKSNRNNQHFVETLVQEEEQMFDYLVAQKCIDFIKQYNGKAPFFLHVGLEKPHRPYTCHKRYMELFSPDKMILPDSWDEIYETGPTPFTLNFLNLKKPIEKYARNTMAAYYACINSMDDQVGKILDAVEEAGITDNTIIVYTTDHGDHMYTHSMQQKHCMYEMASHVPLIISFPNTKKGIRSDALVSLIDLPATFAKEAGVKTPSTFKGKSLKSLVSEPDVERMVFSEFYEGNKNYKMFPQAKTVPMRMVRYKNYKYIYTHGFIEQLYDLEKDPNELDNLVLSSNIDAHEMLLKLRIATLKDWSIDECPQMTATVKKERHRLIFTVEDRCEEYKHLYLVGANSLDFSDAQIIAEGIGDEITYKLGKHFQYYQIYGIPELTRKYKPSKIYSKVPCATESLPLRLPTTRIIAR